MARRLSSFVFRFKSLLSGYSIFYVNVWMERHFNSTTTRSTKIGLFALHMTMPSLPPCANARNSSMHGAPHCCTATRTRDMLLGFSCQDTAALQFNVCPERHCSALLHCKIGLFALHVRPMPPCSYQLSAITSLPILL